MNSGQTFAIMQFFKEVFSETEHLLKGNRALAEVGWREEDTISPSTLMFAAIENKFVIYTLDNPPEVPWKLALVCNLN